MTSTIVGTPAYMAPEQAQVKPIGPYTDIYALGLVLYEMITGSQRLRVTTPVAVALKQIREYPKRLAKSFLTFRIPIEAAILKCLQRTRQAIFSRERTRGGFGESGESQTGSGLAGFYRPGASSSGPEYAPGFA